MEENIQVEDNSLVEGLPEEQILTQDISLEEIESIKESINQLVEGTNEVSGLEQFVVDNSELIVTVMDLICFYGFVGVPLLVIVILFWSVYKQFLYTNI